MTKAKKQLLEEISEQLMEMDESTLQIVKVFVERI